MSPLARWEARLRTGSAAHLLGGALDVVTVLGRHLLARAARSARTRAGRGR
jgi:hypothetical protein